MADLIDRQAAITLPVMPREHREYQTYNLDDVYEQGWFDLQKCIEKMPSAQPESNYDEWCTDCKEYDHERHSCPRWNRVIRETLKDAQPNRPTGEWERGYWISAMTGGMHETWRCSNCKAEVLQKTKYCAECGAEMEGTA